MMAHMPGAQHPQDDLLELYVLGRTTESEAALLEEHVLVCHDCQDRLAQIESFVITMKDACQAEIDARVVPQPRRTGPFARLLGFPAPVWVGSVAAVAVMISLPAWHWTEPVTETEVHLVASRGPVGSAATAGNLRLTIDCVDLPPQPRYRVFIVNTSGKLLWEGESQPANAALNIRPSIRLSSGTYWVRVSGPDGNPLREYPLALR